jgi:hypothetical protein
MIGGPVYHHQSPTNRTLFVIGLFGWFVCASPAAQASSVELLVPAYFYPGTGGPGGSGDGWAAMTAAASQVPITAIFNPNSGPLPGPADPNYVNALTNLKNAGGKVVAYVATNYAGNSLATVEGQISTYISQYGSLIGGFFVDEMSNLPSDVAYYNSLYSYIKGLSSAYQVIGNPGASTVPAYLAPGTQGADVLLTYEGTAANYLSAPPPSWVYGYPSSDFANVIYDEPTVGGVMADLATASARNVGEIYVTDGQLPNPYSQLPSYWDQEVAAIAALPAVVTEPSGWILSLLGLISCGVAIAIRRRKRRVCSAIAWSY